MFKYRHIVRASARRVADAALRTVRSYALDEIEEEPDFTSDMLARMKESMNDFQFRGVRWTAKTLTSHRVNSQETQFGADFIGVVKMDLPDYKVAKGFLAQAKRVEPRASFPQREWDRLVKQSETMLKLSNASFIFLYSRSNVRVLPAIAVTAAQGPCNPHELYARSVARFYEEHFECFVGDRNIHTANIATLEDLQARHGLQLRLRPSNTTGEDD